MFRRTLLSAVSAAPLIAGTPAGADGKFFETIDGQRLFYRDVGTGRPVVFIHGWTLSSAIWRNQFDWLTRRGLRAVAYDRRGHGQSSKPETGYDYGRLTADLAALLDRLDLKDVILVAHSMGSGEAVRYLAQHGSARISHLLLIAPTTPFALKTADNPEGVDKAIYDRLVGALQADRAAYLKSGIPAFLGATPDPELVEWALSIAVQASPKAQEQCMRAFTETDFRRDLKSVTVPTLVQYGTADAPVAPINARRTQAGIAGSRLEIYEGAPHALFLTDMERFNRDLLQLARS